MPSGGARSRSGPAPDPTALRRDRKDDKPWVVLPASGREGEPPAIPLDEFSSREAVLWNELWLTPQSTMWETLHLEREVALYVRSYIAAEDIDAKAADRALVLRMGDSLGLNTAGMHRLRWTIGTVVEQDQSGLPPARRARDRFRVVDGAA